MKRKLFVFLLLTIFAVNIQAQDKFKKWQAFDFSKQKVTKVSLSKFEHEELQLLRGVVFGKRGRIFKEAAIQTYLEKQSWYKPKANFSNKILTATERANIDLIREAEAAKHNFVEPGDLRFWEKKLIPEDKMPYEGAITKAEWDVLIAEFEAIHGKTFPEQEWLQKYFNERYWYKPNPNYTPSVLSEIDRKNMQAFIDAKASMRNVALSPGDMDKFQDVLLKEELLQGLNLNELRVIRNEFWARRGKRFTTPGYRSFFEWQVWYKPLKDQSKVKLNAIEEQNVKLIQAYENKIREKLTTDELTEDMLNGLFAEDLRDLRNEIFARHGYVFKNKDVKKTFEMMDWYKIDPTFTNDKVAVVLSSIEFKNITAIKTAEEFALSKFEEVEG